MPRIDRVVAVPILVLCASGGLAPSRAAEKAGSTTAGAASGIVKTVSSLGFDPGACTVDEESLDWTLGSVSARVLGLIGGDCTFEYTHEMEGGYSVYRVQVPTGDPQVVIREARPTRGGYSPHRIETSFSLAGAELLRHGNVFVDSRSVLASRLAPRVE